MEVKTLELPKCKVSKTGLVFDENLTYDEWELIGKQLQNIHKSIGFWIGDWWNFGEKKWREQAAQAIEFGIDYQTFRNYCYVANNVVLSRRRDNISFSGHAEVAPLEPKKQDEILDKAEQNNLSSRDIRELVKETNKVATPPLPEGKYDCIVADPPWEYAQEQHGKERQETVLETHYPTMPTEDICKLPIKDLSADNCVLFLWTTSPKLYEAKQVIDAWGFEYKSSMIWDKVKHNVGYYVSVRHEILLICTKGSFLPQSDKLIDSVQTIERSDRHSEKPVEFRKIIEEMYPDTKKIELFARTAPEGWEVWGHNADI
jgi:N6-adenosine-specific RNA methylase IME4